MFSDNGILADMAPAFRPYAENVFRDLTLGLCKNRVNFERLSGTSRSGENQFRIVLPYCSKTLKWEILFDPSAPWFAPDFRFDDDTFLSNIEEDVLDNQVPSLSQWDENNPKSLSKVICELVNLYKIHQVKKLKEDENSRANFEYTALLGDSLTSENDIEVWVGGHVVEFLIKLNLDISRLPELYSESPDENPCKDTALLLVRYPNCLNAELVLSPLLNKAVGPVNLPPMHRTGVLMDYVPMVTELLNNRIKAVLNNEKMKRDLLSQMLVKYEGAILEHEANSASFLFETNDFYWILLIDLDVNFPERPPILSLRSVYHSSKGKPKFKVLSTCPYTNFEQYIEQQVELFKIECKGILSKEWIDKNVEIN